MALLQDVIKSNYEALAANRGPMVATLPIRGARGQVETFFLTAAQADEWTRFFIHSSDPDGSTRHALGKCWKNCPQCDHDKEDKYAGKRQHYAALAAAQRRLQG